MRINGAALEAIRERSGMTAVRLAEVAGIDRTMISHLESGRRNASDEVILSLADALKVDVAALLADASDLTELSEALKLYRAVKSADNGGPYGLASKAAESQDIDTEVPT